MEITNQHVQSVIWEYIDRFVESNHAAAVVRAELERAGVGLRPVLDHISVRTLDVQERALEFEAMGFAYDDRLGVLERDLWWGKVYRKPGFPAVFIVQPYKDSRGNDSPIPRWVEKFTDARLHHMAICVDRIEHAVERFTSLGIRFSGEIAGAPGSEFRQIYSEAEVLDGENFSVLELIERRWGYSGFLPPLAGGIESATTEL